MKRYIEGKDRGQMVLLPESLDDFIGEDNPVRVIDLFVEELDLEGPGFTSAEPAATGRPGYHPGLLLKRYNYGYLYRVQSSRRLEREAQRKVEVLWLTGHLAPDAQVSLTEPDARSMATSGRGTGMVGYNVQVAVDTEHHLIVAHHVVNLGHDRTQLASMAGQAKVAVDEETLEALADRGCYKGPKILACEQSGITPFAPMTMTSDNKARGLFAKRDFVYQADQDA